MGSTFIFHPPNSCDFCGITRSSLTPHTEQVLLSLPFFTQVASSSISASPNVCCFLGKTNPLFSYPQTEHTFFPLSFFSAGGGFYFRYLSEFVTASAAAISQKVARRKDGCYTRRYHNGYKNKNCSTVHFILINPLYSVSFTHSVNNKKARLRSRRFANFFLLAHLCKDVRRFLRSIRGVD